jgi:hypothetical protein
MKTIFLFLACVFSFGVAACECPPLADLNGPSAAKYDVIFLGRVDSISPCSTQGIATAYFTIEELYKGSVTREVRVNFECASACLMSFSKGDTWLLYASYLRFDHIKVDLCSHSRKLFAEGEQDIYLMGTQRSFVDERKLLNKLLGTKSFITANELNDQQAEFKPHNVQPSAVSKLVLIGVSIVAMMLVYYFLKRKTKK